MTWFGKFNSVEFGMTGSKTDHLIFYHHLSVGYIYLVVYVDDIVIISNDHLDILDKTTYLPPLSDQRS